MSSNTDVNITADSFVREVKPVIRQSVITKQIDTKFIPMLSCGYEHVNVLDDREEESYREFKLWLINQNCGTLPSLGRMSSTSLGICEITQLDHQFVSVVEFIVNKEVYEYDND